MKISHHFYLFKSTFKSTWLSYQFLIFKPFIKQAMSDVSHLIYSVCITNVMTSCKFIDISIKMIRTHVVINSVVTTLQHRPETLYSIAVCLSFDVFTHRVFHTLMIVQPVIRCAVICYRQLNLFRKVPIPDQYRAASPWYVSRRTL